MLAALRYRTKTGKGQCVELPQIESVVNTLGTAVAEHLVNGTNPSRTGNRSPYAAPHGAFRCQDDPESTNSPDRWVVIACRDDAEWTKAAAVFGHPEAASDVRFATMEARKQNEDALEAAIGEWARERNAAELVEALQAQRVPSGIVQNAQDMLDRDQHMKARGYYHYVDHPEAGREAHDGPAAVLSETPGYIAGPAPLLGEHTMDVCERIIGLTMDEIADLMADGVLV
jgi:benzylsuccinate CoA-transferase BbsF subunit